MITGSGELAPQVPPRHPVGAPLDGFNGRGRAQSTRLYAFRLGVVGLRAAETEETFVLLGVAGGRYCNDRPGL